MASLHTSWTQWKNLFSFEVHGLKGSLNIDGLGGSYGIEKLTIAIRDLKGGVPKMSEEIFDQPDLSWRDEWNEMVKVLSNGGGRYSGTPSDGVAAMAMINGLYESAKKNTVTFLESQSLV